MSHPKKYVLIIECGPNTSKFHLFEYTVEYGRANSPLRQCGHTEIGPGISSFGKNATASAEAIVREANSVITKGVPSASRKDTRIFLGAATDVRLLERINAKEAEALMLVMRKTVADPALEGVVESPKDDVRILSDANEAFFLWLVVNYRMGNFLMVSERVSLHRIVTSLSISSFLDQPRD
ncbi:Ectonucleoside triphosphate diphosphohydrolase 8 [Taenia solium]|eukprot:TsM_001136400 transcript=TsM_001136400 gene=TsM_001136400